METELWPLAVEVMRALGPRYGPAMAEAALAAGLERPVWFQLISALRFHPDPISAVRLRIRTPYSAPHYFEEGLATLTERGMLAPAGSGAYRLTEKGRVTAQQIANAAYACMAALAPLPASDLETLASLLRRLVEASLAAPEPPGKWSIRLNRRIDPGPEAPVIARVDQYLSDLGFYRDDAHLAAWRPHGLDGPAWEAFTLLWRGAAETVDELYEALSWRGYGRKTYAASVQALGDRGWVEATGEKLRLTGHGQAIRRQAEDETNRGFFTPWVALSQAELKRLGDLLGQLRDAL